MNFVVTTYEQARPLGTKELLQRLLNHLNGNDTFDNPLEAVAIHAAASAALSAEVAPKMHDALTAGHSVTEIAEAADISPADVVKRHAKWVRRQKNHTDPDPDKLAEFDRAEQTARYSLSRLA